MVKAFAARLRRIADRLDPPAELAASIHWQPWPHCTTSTTTGTVWINSYTNPPNT